MAEPTKISSANNCNITPRKPTPAEIPVEYKVKSGDTLSGIARQFGVSTNALLDLNPQITDGCNRSAKGDVIFAGETLRLKKFSVEAGADLEALDTNRNGVLQRSEVSTAKDRLDAKLPTVNEYYDARVDAAMQNLDQFTGKIGVGYDLVKLRAISSLVGKRHMEEAVREIAALPHDPEGKWVAKADKILEAHIEAAKDEIKAIPAKMGRDIERSIIKTGLVIGDVASYAFDKTVDFAGDAMLATELAAIELGHDIADAADATVTVTRHGVGTAVGGVGSIVDGVGDVIEGVGHMLERFGQFIYGEPEKVEQEEPTTPAKPKR